MTNFTQIFLGAAVAGVVAGTGSVVGAAVAYAEPSAPDTSTSAGQTAGESASRNDTPARRPSRGPAAAPAPAAATRGGASIAADEAGGAPQSIVRAQTTVRGQNNDEPAPPAEVATPWPAPTRAADNARQQALAPTPPSAPAAVNVAPVSNDVPQAVSTPAAGRVPSPAAAVASASTAPAVLAVDVPDSAAAVVLTPAPAAPAPTPVRAPLLPLLPTIPAVPIAPASAVTVSAGSGINTRVRAASAVAQAAVLADPPTHVLLIGTDGTNLSKILEYAYTDGSGFKTVMDGGVTGATSIVGHTTISGPSWSTILTGVWDSKTGVINNLFRPEPYKQWPTVINLLEYNKPAIDTTVIADWQYISDVAGAGGYPADTNIYVAPVDKDFAASSAQVTADTIKKIQAVAANPGVSSFIFSYQVEVDEAGHEYGGGSAEYKQAVINVGANIEQIMTAVQAAENTTGQDWTVIVTTDHGHQQSKGFGHGFQSPNETSTFVMFDLAGDSKNDGKQNLNYSTVNITPTIVSLFGVPQRSDFDGVPMQTDPAILNSIVTPVNLKQSLNDAIATFGYPNIGTDITLATRTVIATVPYLLDGLFTDVIDALQWVVDKDIFLISGLADITQWIVQVTGDVVVGITNATARGICFLLGAGNIPPTDPPLPAPPANSELPAPTGDSVLPWLIDATAVLA